MPGKAGQCVQLDGQQDYIDSGTTLADLGQTFTIECWVNPADHQNLHADVFGNHSDGGYGFVVEQDADNTNVSPVRMGRGQGNGSARARSRLAADKWQHLALVKTPTELRLYVNGIPVAVARTMRRCSLRRSRSASGTASGRSAAVFAARSTSSACGARP